ncbi:UPF0179 family protein [[Eubacterium] cellulosolvens]
MSQKVTLIGKKQARIGFRFLFEGEAGLCSGCSVKKVCVGNLKHGRLYEIVKISDKSFPCILHSEKAVVVEVSEPLIDAAIFSKTAISGALIKYEKHECDKWDCNHWDRCFPSGLTQGDRCKVAKVKGSLSCPLGVQLLLVSLQMQDEVS